MFNIKGLKFKNKLLVLFFPFVTFFNLNNNIAINLSYLEKENIDVKKIKDVALGENFSFAVITDLKDKDLLFSWGANDVGQLGLGNQTNFFTPQRVELPIEGKIKSVEAGYKTASLIITDNEDKEHLYMWGENFNGQLGVGDTENRNKLTEVILPEEGKIKFLNCSQSFNSMVITNSNGEDSLYTWGSNSQGQLGNGSFGTNVLIPTKIKIPEKGNVKFLDSGRGHSALVVNDPTEDKDTLFTWGTNFFGQLGLGSNGQDSFAFIPTKVEALPLDGRKIKDVSLGSDDSFVLLTDGTNDTLYSWGYNTSGQLGVGDNNDRNEPFEVGTISNKEIKNIISGSYHASAIVTNGTEEELYMWGDNVYSQLGNGNNSGNSEKNPIKIDLPIEGKIEKISLKVRHSSMIMIDNNNVYHLYMWGSNEQGELGLDSWAHVNRPTELFFNISGKNKEKNSDALLITIIVLSVILVIGIIIIVAYFIKKKIGPSENRKIYTSI